VAPSCSSLSFQIAYGDCDAAGIVYFATYFRWMERAYTSWLFANGVRGGEQSEDLGGLAVGVSAGADYLRMVRVFDMLDLQVVLDRIGTSSYTLGYEFTRGDELVTRGHIVYAFRDHEFGKQPLPQRLIELLQTLPESRLESRRQPVR
jgi:acyl-CoA thioester hydrolase